MNGILVSFLVRIAVRMFVSLRIEISPKPFAALALTALIAMFAIWVWQLAGIWRSASKHVLRGGKPFWALLAKAVVIFVAIYGCANICYEIVPQSIKWVRVISDSGQSGDKASSGNQVDAEMKALENSPWFKVVRDTNPKAADNIAARFLAGVRAGRPVNEVAASVGEQIDALIARCLPAASDDALLALRDFWIEILVRYKDSNSRACVKMLMENGLVHSRDFPNLDTSKSNELLAKLISGDPSKTPVSIDNKAAQEDLEAILGPILEKFGNDVKLLNDEKQWMNNSQKFCEIYLLMLQQIKTLPDHQSANLFRSLLFDDSK